MYKGPLAFTGKEMYQLVETALDQLELRPHAKKLAERLSGGMKRKLCVAIWWCEP